MSCYQCKGEGQIARIINKWAREEYSSAGTDTVEELATDLYNTYRARMVRTEPYGSYKFQLLEATLDEVNWTDIARKIIEERE